MKILVADDSKTNLSLITASLQKLGHEVISAVHGPQAIEKFQLERPDLIILDVVMDGMNGFECAKKIRSISIDDWIPIIFLSGSVDNESIAKGIDAGGDDYLTKPFSEITLAAKIKAMQRISDMRKDLFEAKQNLTKLSSTDTLTGIYNRFQFNKVILEKIAHARRHDQIMAILFVDLDKFKFVNDTLGHHAGDLLLIEVSKRLQSCLRVDDFLARMGGDEFAVILSDIETRDTAGIIAQKIIDVLAPFYNVGGKNINTGSSIGIACYPTDGLEQIELLKNADIAMYHAKKTGRNRYKYFSKEITNIASVQSDVPRKITPKKKLLVLHCLVNRNRVCIDLGFIEKCLPLSQLEMMPNSPDYLVGLMNIAHRSVPIIDLGARLNLKRTACYTLDTPILLCSDGTHEIGVIVDKIIGLEELKKEELQMREYIDNPNSLFIATATFGSNLSFLINMQYILAININKNTKDLDSIEPVVNENI